MISFKNFDLGQYRSHLMDDEGYYEDHDVKYDCVLHQNHEDDYLDENHEDDYLDDGNHGEGHGLDENHEVNDDLDDFGVDQDENDVDHENHELHVNHG